MGLLVEPLGDAAHDPFGHRPIGMRDRDHAEVLILQADAAARSRHPRHLAHDAQRVGDVEENRDGQRGVEAVRGEGQARAVGDPQRDAGATRGLPTEGARPIEHTPAGVDADDRTPAPDACGEVTDDHAGAAAHLEHTFTRPDRNELQEASAQPRVRSAPLLETRAVVRLDRRRLCVHAPLC